MHHDMKSHLVIHSPRILCVPQGNFRSAALNKHPTNIVAENTKFRYIMKCPKILTLQNGYSRIKSLSLRLHTAADARDYSLHKYKYMESGALWNPPGGAANDI